MKKLFIVLTILSICRIAKAVDVNSFDPNLYLQKIKELEQIVKAQQQKVNRLTAALEDVRKQLAEQIKENEKLKALLPKDKINSVVPATGFDPNNGIVYNGKKRDIRWFNYMYNRFRDKIYLNHEHKYKFLTSLPKPSQDIQLDSEHIGSIGFLPYRSIIRSVINEGEILIEEEQYEGNESITIHIYGLDKDFYVGEYLPIGPKGKWFINTGTFKYTAIHGRKMTVPSLTPYPPKPLTKEQFTDAINSGIELIDENKQPVP